MADKDYISKGEPIDYKLYLEYLDQEEQGGREPYNPNPAPEDEAPRSQRDRELEEKYAKKPAKSKKKAKVKKISAPKRSRREEEPPRKGKKARKSGKASKKGGKKSFFKRPGGIVLIILMCLVVLGAAGLGAYYWFMGDLGKNAHTETTDTLPIDSEDDTTHGGDVEELNSYELNGAIKQWYDANNDNWMYNNKIMNVLLIGEDDSKGATYGRSDSMILISVNTITKEIHMVSFWRDSYGLIVHDQDGGEAYVTYEKINGANAYGGPDLVVSTIEHLYKIRIDGWVMTDFSKFKKLIDAMGGIDVNVKEYENDFLLRTAPVSWPTSHVGKSHLNGREALVFARIRHLDSDVNRAERQRKVIKAIINKAGSLSITQLTKAVKKFLPYLSTSYSKGQILTLAMKAVLGGWSEFKMNQQSAPLHSNTQSYKSGTINTAWVWVVDYPLAAQDVQNYLYGETKINLAQNRVNWINLV